MAQSLSAVSVGEVAGIAGALALLVGLIRKVFPWLGQLVHFLDDITGEAERKGRPARPGLLERQADVESALEEIRLAVKELRPNGGGSIKDHMTKLTQSAALVEARVGDATSAIESLRSSYEQHIINGSQTETELRAAVAALQHKVME